MRAKVVPVVLGALESIEMRIPVELIQRVIFSGWFWRLKGEKKANKGCLLLSLANCGCQSPLKDPASTPSIALGIFNNNNDITTTVTTATATATAIITRLPFHIYKLLSICNNDQRRGRLD